MNYYASKNASDSLNSLDTHVQVVIPAAGQGSRFSKAGWKKPKPFIDINGRPMLDHVICNVMPKQNASCSLILRSEHKDTYHCKSIKYPIIIILKCLI